MAPAPAPHCQTNLSDQRAAAKGVLRSATRQIGLLVYPGFDLLDLSGPLEAFFWAQHHVPGSYQLRVMSVSGGLVHGGPLRVETETVVRHGLDTLIVIGGRVDQATCDTELIEYVRAAASGVRRVASVCTGAFVLAQAGLLDGRAATTHWSAIERLQTAFPSVRVRQQCIYVKDENVWSSAGITAGIDLSLALIEEDLGRELALTIARMLVVYMRRAGDQPQQSLLLEHDALTDRIQRVLSYAREHLREPLRVEHLAAVAHLSVRQFSRAFRAATSTTPAKAIERMRVESAKHQVEHGHDSFDEIAHSVGFTSAGQMRASFLSAFGDTPQALRRRARVG